MTSKTHADYRADIDGLRAIAILAVVGFHILPESISGGFFGVDIFFVISGFLISGIVYRGLAAGTFSFLDFYYRRIKRIFPALILVLAACLAAGWFLLFADEYGLLGKHIAAAAIFTSNLVSMREFGYFDPAAELRPLLHLWSLGVEEQFYLVWPALLSLAYKAKRNSLLAFALSASLTSFLAALWLAQNDQTAAFFSPLTRFWQLLIGSSLAYWAMKSKRHAALSRMHGNWLAIGGLAFISSAIIWMDHGNAHPVWSAAIPTIGTCMVIAAGANAWINARILGSAAMVYVGKISYPLYLWHWPLLSFAAIVLSGEVSWMARLALAALSIALADLTYRIVERRIRLHVGTTLPICLAAILGVVGLAGAATYKEDGLKFRPIELSARFDLAKLGNERSASIRYPNCHFGLPNQRFSDFRAGAEDCIAIMPGLKNVMVIGDSHAVDLWSALSMAYPNINFLQVTGSGCVPIEAMHRANDGCAKMIAYAKHGVSGMGQVDAAILSARWPDNFGGVIDDIVEFKAMGIPVLVFGPTFEFSAAAPKIIGRNLAVLRDREIEKFSIQSRFKLDNRMSAFMRKHDVPYVSKIDLLCVGGVCPILDERKRLLVIDYGHWTTSGARRFGTVFAENRSLEFILDGMNKKTLHHSSAHAP